MKKKLVQFTSIVELCIKKKWKNNRFFSLNFFLAEYDFFSLIACAKIKKRKNNRWSKSYEFKMGFHKSLYSKSIGLHTINGMKREKKKRIIFIGMSQPKWKCHYRRMGSSIKNGTNRHELKLWYVRDWFGSMRMKHNTKSSTKLCYVYWIQSSHTDVFLASYLFYNSKNSQTL